MGYESLDTHAHEWVYHYTNAGGIAGILRSGKILACRIPLYSDALRTRLTRITPPAVWLTTDGGMEKTVLIKEAVDRTPPGEHIYPHKHITSIYRVVIRRGYGGDLRLGDYAARVGFAVVDFKWNIRSGMAADSRPEDWRVVPEDIPRGAWVRVERCLSLDERLGYWWQEQRNAVRADGEGQGGPRR